MSYATQRFGFGAALMMSSALAINPVHRPASTYEARLTGAMALELRGASAEFGTAPGSPGPFVGILGAPSEEGAVFSLVGTAARQHRGPIRSRPDPFRAESRR